MKKISDRRSDSCESLTHGRPNWERLVLRVIATLGFTVFVFSPIVVSQVQAETPTPTILVFNYSQASPMTIRLAETEAGRILGEAGFPAAWVNCPRTSSTTVLVCEKEQVPGEIRVRILAGHTQNKFQDSVFGFVMAPVFASVYYESALRPTKIDSAEFEAPAILGCVIAHEIGHLLLGPNSHTNIGIMQPRWESTQIRQIMKGTLVFTAEQSAVMRAEARRRMKLQTAHQ